MSKNIFKLSVILIVLTFSVSACSLSWPLNKKAVVVKLNSTSTVATDTAVTPVIKQKTAYTNKLKKFSNYSELSQFLANNINFTEGNRNSTSSNLKNISSSLNNYLAPFPVSESSALVQPNIIKTDGTYVYVLTADNLIVSKIVPNDKSQIVSKVTFQSRPTGMLLLGNFLVVYGPDTQFNNQALYHSFKRKNSYTFLKIFDVSNPAQLKQTRNLEFEGSYLSLTSTGNYLYFLTSTPGNYLPGEPVLPRVLENGQILANSCAGATKCFTPEVYYFDINYNSYHFVNLTLINFKNNAEALSGQVYIAPRGQSFHLSSKNLTIVYAPVANYKNLEQEVKQTLLYPKLATSSKNRINKIEASADFILNSKEKKFKISQIIDNYLFSLSAKNQASWQLAIASSTKQKLDSEAVDFNTTFIYKMAIKNNSLVYQAFGKVAGTFLNHSVFNSSNGNLYLITISNPLALNLANDSSKHYNNIYILDPNLKIIGSLSNLVTKEPITAVRFLGNRLYLITAQASAPLFVISLKTLTKPAVLGAIQIPGISNYLQPLDANGQRFVVFSTKGEITYSDGSKKQGMTESLFDFSDLSHPRELASYLIGSATSSHSIIFQDQDSIFYSADKNLLSLPISFSTSTDDLSFSGVLVSNISNNSISIKGKIDHSSGGYFNELDDWNKFTYHNNTVKRSLIIDNDLLTFSNKFLKLNSLPNLKSLASIELTKAGDTYRFKALQSSHSSSSLLASSSQEILPTTKSQATSTNSISPLSPEVNSSSDIIPPLPSGSDSSYNITSSTPPESASSSSVSKP